MDPTESAITVETAWGTLGEYGGQTIGVLALTADGIDAASRTMQFISELTTWEVDAGDAPGYARQTFTAAYSIVGSVGTRRGVLGFGPGQSASMDLAGAPSVAGFAFYDPTGGSDSARQIISINRVAPGAGFDGYPVTAPNGFATVAAEPRDLTTRVTSLEARTVPDAADGSPGQVWMTDGAVGDWVSPLVRTFTASFFGQINPAHAAGFYPAIDIGCTLADVDGLTGTIRNVGYLAAGSIAGATPTFEDIPGVWNEVDDNTAAVRAGSTVPLDAGIISGFVTGWSAGDPLWIRNDLYDEDGIVATTHTYYAALTEDDTVDVDGWLLVGRTVTAFSIPGAATTGTEGTAVTHDVELPWWEPRVHAHDTRYDPATSGLTATDVQAAIDEIAGGGGGGGSVASVNGHTGTVVLTASDVGAATASDIAAAVAGFDWKASVRACSTSNIASLSGTTTVDGVSLIAGDRVLLAGQSTGSQNGIYVVAAGAWSRATDADVSAEVTAGMSVPVAEGTSNGDAVWVLTTNDPITLGSTSLAFTKIPMVQGLVPASNLSDVANPATALVNLGGVPTSRTFAGLSLAADRSVSDVLAETAPRRIVIYPAAEPPTSYSGTWTPTASSSATNGGYANSGATANDSSWTWANLLIPPGTWECRLIARKNSALGIATVTLGGSSFGTADLYDAAPTFNNQVAITGVTVSTGGFKDLVITNPTKNGSSSGYSLSIQAIILRRTGA